MSLRTRIDPVIPPSELIQWVRQRDPRPGYNGRVFGTNWHTPSERIARYEVASPLRSTRRSDSWNEFQHYKAETNYTVGEFSLGTLIYDTYDYEGTPYCKGTFADSMLSYKNQYGIQGTGETSKFPSFLVSGVPEDGFIPFPEGLDELLSSALSRTMPQVKSQLSLVNSVIELKDFKSLAKKGLSIAKLLPKAKEALAQVLKLSYAELKTAKKAPIHTAADWYLQNAFAIQPLLSDIAGIRKAIRNTTKRIDSILRDASRLRTCHVTIPVHDLVYGTEETSSYQFGIGPSGDVDSLYGRFFWQREVLPQVSTLHVEVQYSYSLSAFQTAHAQLLGFLDALGVKSTPKIIWNAIPWTFVVDWVIDVNRWLTRFESNNIQPTVNIRRCLWSFKRERLITLHRKMVRNSNISLPWIPDSIAAVTKEVSYVRKPFVPRMSQLCVGGLTASQISLGVALAITRKKRHH